MSEYCTNCKDMADKLAAANARVAELEARLLKVGPAYTGALMRVNEVECICDLVLEDRDSLAHSLAGKLEELTAMREAVAGVMPILDCFIAISKKPIAQTAGKPDVMDSDVAAIERLRREVGG